MVSKWDINKEINRKINTRPNCKLLKVVDKFTKLSKIGFSMEYFTAELWRFCSTDVKICL